MKKKSQYIFLVLCTIVSACKQQNHSSLIDKLVNQLYQERNFNGAVIVSENNEVIYCRGFGYADFEKQIPFTTSTTMDAGSMTKPFTALAIFILEQENMLSLNDPVVDHISSFPYDNVKIKHLVNHTSGLVSEDFVFSRAEEGKVIINDFFLNVLVDNIPPLSHEPGSQFQYNGINYILLAMIIERISGAPFDEYIREKITEPLEMNDWFLRPPRLSDWTDDRTKGYKIIDDSLTVSDSEDFEGFYGDCNLFFSAEDLLKWSQSFYLNTLMSREYLDKLLKAKDSNSSLNVLHWYALKGSNQFHFTGHWRGFYTMVYFDIDKRRSIVYLCNTSMEYWLRPNLVTALVNILDDKNTSLTEPHPVKPSREYLNATYDVSGFGTVLLNEENERLLITFDSVTYELYSLDSQYFYEPLTDLWIWFNDASKQGLTINCVNIYGNRTGRRTG